MATKFEYKDPTEYDIVKEANANLGQLGNKPVVGQSQWENTLNDTINKIMNKEKFSYDLNGDALYKQYKDQYTTQGKMAMMDTMGQAAAMTGGYGNSYASTVGNQAYQGYLQQLNDRVPELYQLALDKYNQEGQDLLNQYALLNEQDTKQYEKDRNALSDWYAERDYLTGRADDAYNKAYNDLTFKYGMSADELANEWNEKQFKYTQERDAVADAQWQQQFDLAKNSGNGGNGGNGGESLLGGWSEKDFTEAMQEAAELGDKKYAMALVIAAGDTDTAHLIYEEYFGEEEEEIDTDVPPLKKGGGGSGGGAGKFAVHYVN